MTPQGVFNLEGKVAIVTGGSRGLGREIARGMSFAGAELVIASRNAVSCQDTAESIQSETGHPVFPLAAHVGHWEEFGPFVAAVMERYGRIDILVNNAGMSPLFDSLVDVSEELFDKVINVNLKGPFRLSILVGVEMQKSGGGSIINVSSTVAARPRADVLPYAMAKAGLNAMTKGLAQAVGPSVRVNAIMAGTFLTDVSKSWNMSVFADRAERFALKRGARPDEIVGTALYLASEASSYTTGSIITVDGGQP